MGSVLKVKKNQFDNGNLRRLGKRHCLKVSYAVDRTAVAEFNRKQRLRTPDRKRRYKHPAQ